MRRFAFVLWLVLWAMIPVEMARAEGLVSSGLVGESPTPAQAVIRNADSNRLIVLSGITQRANFPLTLVPSTGHPDFQHVSLSLGALTRKDGAAGGTATASLDRASELSSGREGLATVQLTVDLPEQTTYVATLVLFDGNQHDIYTINVTRGPAPALTVRGLVDNKLSVSSSDFTYPLMLTSSSGLPAIDDLVVSIDPIGRQDGKPARDAALSCTPCAPNKISLTPNQTVSLTLTGRTLEQTTYVSTLWLRYQDQSQSVPLIVTRAVLLQNLSLVDPGTVAGDHLFPNVVPSLMSTVDVDVIVKETGGQSVQIGYPRLESLHLVDKSATEYGVTMDHKQLFRQNTGGPTSLPDAASAATAGDPLPANSTASYVYRIGGLSAGTYKGRITVSGPDSAEVSKDFTLTIRDNWLWAALVLAAGVICAYLLYSYTRGGRARDVRSAQIAQEQDAAHLLLVRDPFWKAVVHDLMGRLEVLDRQNRIFKNLSDADFNATFGDISKRVTLGHQIADRRIGIMRLTSTYPDQPPALLAKKNGFHDRLNTQSESAQEALMKPTGEGIGDSTPGDAPAIVKSLDTLLNDIKVDVGTLVPRALNDSLDEFMTAHPDSASSKDAEDTQSDVKTILDKMAVKNLAGLPTSLEKTRTKYANVRTKHLREAIDQALVNLSNDRINAVQVSPGTWTAIEGQLGQAKDAVEAIEANSGRLAGLPLIDKWQEAHDQYLGALIMRLKALASEEGRPTGVDPTAWTTKLEKYSDIEVSLNDADARLRANDSAGASEAYQDARDKYLLLLNELATLPHPEAREALKNGTETVVAGPSATSRVAPNPDLLRIPRSDQTPGRSAAAWDAAIKRHDLAILAIVIVAAVASGIVAVWSSNPTFGSVADYVGAFLWGFSLQSASSFVSIAQTTGVLSASN